MLIQWEGKPAKLSFLRDITEQTKLETQLQQAQKLESIGTLAGGIAHDFNNILSGIFGYTQILQIKMRHNPELLSYLDSIYNAGERAKDLVKQILTFSRHRVGTFAPIEISPVVKEAMKLIESILPSTISIEHKINENCEPVLADATQIHQIVMNLCTNAYHSMEEEGGKLTVTLQEIELEAKDLKDPNLDPGKFLILTVADTGKGMDQNVMDHIFEPYFTTKEEGKGTGMGLAVIHGIVKSHGGQITVHSEQGNGAEFKVYLPVIKFEKETEALPIHKPLPKGNERILVVDDEKYIAEIAQEMLAMLGYKVTVKTDSLEALEIFRARPDQFDLVITDMTMPHMTGDTLVLEIMKIRPEIPVLLCTGFSERMSEKKAASLGIKGFLMKPLAINDLSATIRKILDQN